MMLKFDLSRVNDKFNTTANQPRNENTTTNVNGSAVVSTTTTTTTTTVATLNQTQNQNQNLTTEDQIQKNAWHLGAEESLVDVGHGCSISCFAFKKPEPAPGFQIFDFSALTEFKRHPREPQRNGPSLLGSFEPVPAFDFRRQQPNTDFHYNPQTRKQRKQNKGKKQRNTASASSSSTAPRKTKKQSRKLRRKTPYPEVETEQPIEAVVEIKESFQVPITIVAEQNKIEDVAVAAETESPASGVEPQEIPQNQDVDLGMQQMQIQQEQTYFCQIGKSFELDSFFVRDEESGPESDNAMLPGASATSLVTPDDYNSNPGRHSLFLDEEKLDTRNIFEEDDNVC